MCRQQSPDGRDEIPLGAAGVCNQRLHRDRCRQLGKHAIVLLDRHGKQNNVGAFDGLRNVFDRFVDNPQFERALDIGTASPDTDNAPHFAGAPERRRDRSADQTDADDNQPVAVKIAQESGAPKQAAAAILI